MQTTPELDTFTDDPVRVMRWTKAEKVKFPYEHSRPLPTTTAQAALDYIKVLTEGFPLQIRYAMALPLWYRFADAWCDTGDEQESLRVI